MEIQIKNARLSFPDLWTPRAFKEGLPAKYKATFLVPKDSPMAKQIDKAIEKVAMEKWPKTYAKVLASIQGNANKLCWQDGDNKDYDGYEGMMAFSANNKARPTVWDRDGKTPLTEDDGKPYAGCYVNGLVDIFAYDNSGNGISASLSGIQFVKDGEAFSGGRPAPAGAFADLGVDEEDEAFV